MSFARLNYSSMGFRTFPVAFIATGPVCFVDNNERVHRATTETESEMYLDYIDSVLDEGEDVPFVVDVPIDFSTYNHRMGYDY